jgi:hypothetical protein
MTTTLFGMPVVVDDTMPHDWILMEGAEHSFAATNGVLLVHGRSLNPRDLVARLAAGTSERPEPEKER